MLLSLRKYLYWSGALHGGVLLTLLVSSLISFHRNPFLQEKIVWVSLPKGTAERLGSPMKRSENLPQTTIQEQKKAIESPAAGQKKPQMTYKIPFKKTKAAPKQPGSPDSAIEKALSKMRKQVATKKAEPEAAQIPGAEPGGFSVGTATGPYVPPDDPEYVLYQAKVRKRIMDEWILPTKYADAALGLICQIVVHMNDQGVVVEKEWQVKSGNPVFDMSAMRAVEKASPLDIPPERLKYEVFKEGFLVEFKPSAAVKTQ